MYIYKTVCPMSMYWPYSRIVPTLTVLDLLYSGTCDYDIYGY